MKQILCFLALAFPLLASACTPDFVKFSNGMVLAMPPDQTTTAAYMNIENISDKRITIVGVSADAAKNASIHTSVTNKHGLVSMRMLDTLVLEPHSTTYLSPGGIHIMLSGMTKQLKETPPTTVTLTFKYSDDSTSTVTSIPVKSVIPPTTAVPMP